MDLPGGGMGVLGESRRGPNTELGLGLDWERSQESLRGTFPVLQVSTRAKNATFVASASPA